MMLWLPIRSAANACHVSEQTVRRLISGKRLVAEKRKYNSRRQMCVSVDALWDLVDPAKQLRRVSLDLTGEQLALLALFFECEGIKTRFLINSRTSLEIAPETALHNSRVFGFIADKLLGKREISDADPQLASLLGEYHDQANS